MLGKFLALYGTRPRCSQEGPPQVGRGYETEGQNVFRQCSVWFCDLVLISEIKWRNMEGKELWSNPVYRIPVGFSSVSSPQIQTCWNDLLFTKFNLFHKHNYVARSAVPLRIVSWFGTSQVLYIANKQLYNVNFNVVNLWRLEIFWIIVKSPVRSALYTLSVPVIKTSHFMFIGE